jgi:hypothetical protein
MYSMYNVHMLSWPGGPRLRAWPTLSGRSSVLRIWFTLVVRPSVVRIWALSSGRPLERRPGVPGSEEASALWAKITLSDRFSVLRASF